MASTSTPTVHRTGLLWRRLQRLQGYFGGQFVSLVSPVIVTVVLFCIGLTSVSDFVSRDNLDSMLLLASLLGISAAGQTLVIILGGIDLSIAGMIGFAEVAVAVLSEQGMPMWQIMLLLLGCGVFIGIVNGGISSVFRVHPLIVTLGVGLIIEGGVLLWTTGGSAQGVTPVIFQRMTAINSKVGPVPIPPITLVWLAVAVVLILLERRTSLGRYIYALGSNGEAAGLALARRRSAWIGAYIVSAVSASLTGAFLSGLSGGPNIAIGNPYLFTSIAAVVVGGTSLLGGRGGYGRTILGSVVIIELTTILVGVGIGPNLQQSLLGVFIILVVAASGREIPLRMRV